MKKMHLLLVLFMTAALALSACSAPDTVTSAATGEDPALSDDVLSAHQQFTLNLLQALCADSPGENCLFSPLAVQSMLTMAWMGADGDTARQMAHTLCMGGLTAGEGAAIGKALPSSRDQTHGIAVRAASSLWIDKAYRSVVRPQYLNDVRDAFDAHAEIVGLNGKNGIARMNKWASDATEGLIGEMLESRIPRPELAMILCSVMYFRGLLTLPFDPQRTTEEVFHGVPSDEPADMMFLYNTINGYEDDRYQAVRLPYGGDGRFAMVVVLPMGDVDDFIGELTATDLHTLLTCFESKPHATVRLPRFEIKQSGTLDDILKAMGMNLAFGRDADFSGIFEIEGIGLDTVQYATVITIDEAGTEAAGSATGPMAASAGSFLFIADRPFLFFVTDTRSGAILFAGKVMNPAKKT